MKKLLTIICVAILMMACGSSEQQLKERAAELCQYIPDHELKEVSKDYMTPEFYNVLDTLPAMIILLTSDYHVAFANRRFRKRFGDLAADTAMNIILDSPGLVNYANHIKCLKPVNPIIGR